MEHCHIELARFDESEGIGFVRFAGGCPDCELSPATFVHAIEAHLRRRVPELRQLRFEGGE